MRKLTGPSPLAPPRHPFARAAARADDVCVQSAVCARLPRCDDAYSYAAGSMSSSDPPPEFGLLHALLFRDVATDKAEIKRLLHRHHNDLLRTLERSPSADRVGGAPAKQPAFPAFTPNATTATDPAIAAAMTLLQTDERAASQMVLLLKRDAYNDAQALSTATTTTRAAEQALLAAELALLRHTHEQRCLLLRCVHQLLFIAYDATAELHTVACGQVALLLEVRRHGCKLLPSTPPVTAAQTSCRRTHARTSSLPLLFCFLLVLPTLCALLPSVPPPLPLWISNSQGRLAQRIVDLIPTLTKPTSAEVRARLPKRFRDDQKKPDEVSEAAERWVEQVGHVLAIHVARERCEALGLLLLLRYMPLHHTSEPETLGPLSDLLDNSAGTPTGALYAMMAGAAEETPSLTPLLAALAPLLSPSPPPAAAALSVASLAASGGTGTLAAWEKRAEQLATLILMSAMHGEKEYCQLHSRPTIARTPLAHTRHSGLTAELLSLARAAQSSAAAGFSSSSAGGALGSLLITWCVVLLEVAPADTVAEAAANLATAGEALEGLSWARELLRTPGFRHDDPAEEISSIARLLLFDLAGGMLDQPRYRSSSGGGGGGGPAPPPTLLIRSPPMSRPRWARPPWSRARPPLPMSTTRPFAAAGPHIPSSSSCSRRRCLRAAQASAGRSGRAGRRASFRRGSLSSMLLHARYPLRVEPLASLLSALCADADSASRAWGFGRSLMRVCHRAPKAQLESRGVVPFATTAVGSSGGSQQQQQQGLHATLPLTQFGTPPLALPADSVGATVSELAYEENESGVVIEWQLPAEQSLDIGPRLGEAVEALLRAGARASPELVRSAECALALLAHAPSAHTPSELLDLLPPLSSLVELLPLCAQLSGQLPADIERPISLLSLQLLASIAPHMPQQLAVALDRAWQLWSDSSWLPGQTTPATPRRCSRRCTPSHRPRWPPPRPPASVRRRSLRRIASWRRSCCRRAEAARRAGSSSLNCVLSRC